MSEAVLREPYKRRRTRGQFYPSTKTSQWGNSSQTAPAPISVSTTSGSRGTVEQMDDTVTPGYKKLSALGYIINNDMSRVKTTRSTSTSGPKFGTTVNGIEYWGDLEGPNWTSDILTDARPSPNRPQLTINVENMIAVASTRAFANIGQPDYEGLVTLGEARETLKYLRNPVAAGIKLADTLARHARKSGLTRGKTRRDMQYTVRDPVKDVASIYLSILYGFKPLVTEIVGIIENLRPRAVPRPDRKTSRAKEVQTISDSWSTLEGFANGQIMYTASYSYVETVTVKVGFLYANKEEMCTEEQWGIRPKDVAPAVWAVMSKSFVIDWFTNFGDFVSALVPSANTRVLNQFTTVETRRTLKRTVSGYTFGNWGTTRPGSGTDVVEVVITERNRHAAPPSLVMKDLTPLKNDVSRLMSMVAMLTGTLKSAGNPPSITKTTRTGKILSPDKWY